MLAPVQTTAEGVEAVVRAAYAVKRDFDVFTEPRLAVSLHDGTPVLVWQLSVLAEGFLGSVDLEIDASTGRIHREEVLLSGIAATGCDPHGNQVSINTTHPLGKPYQLHDKTRPGKIRGYDQQESETWTQDFPHEDQDNSWCATNQEGPVQGHANMAKVLDHFDTRYGRNSYDDSGGNIKMGFDASWDDPNVGLTQSVAQFIGNGRFRFGSPMFSNIDVVAHEFTHAVLNAEGIAYSSYEGQAVNEHLSDLFGVFVEEDFSNADGTWNLVMGEGTGRSRDLQSPSVSQNHYSEFVSEDWEQYDNSEILSLGFALLVSGGVHPQSGVAVPPMDLYDLRDIYYEAVTEFMGPGDVNFIELREAVASSTDALFGVGSDQAHAVRAAFIAAGVTPATFNLVAWADDFQTWHEWSNSVTFGAPQSSPGVGFTSAKMEDGKLYDGEMMGMTPGGGAFGHVAGEYQLRLPHNVTVGNQVFAPHLQAEIGFPLIAVDSDEALILVQLRDSDDITLMQSYITVRRDDGLVDTLDWDLEALAGTSVTLRIVVSNTGAVPTRPVMFDSLHIERVWQ